MIPVVDEPADGAVISLCRGDVTGAALSTAAMEPDIGAAATTVKTISKVVGVGQAAYNIANATAKNQHRYIVFFTNKSSKYIKQFESITKKYKLKLDSDWNKAPMPPK